MTLKFKQLLEKLSKDEEAENGLHSNFPLIHRPGLYRFTGSVHALSQSRDRHPTMSPTDWKDFHGRVEKHLNSIPWKDKKNGNHLFYSKSKDIGYVAAVNHQDRKIHVVTVLPKNRGNPMPGTEKVLVEMVIE